MGAFECPAVGSSVFSSPLVELITWGETRVSRGSPGDCNPSPPTGAFQETTQFCPGAPRCPRWQDGALTQTSVLGLTAELSPTAPSESSESLSQCPWKDPSSWEPLHQELAGSQLQHGQETGPGKADSSKEPFPQPSIWTQLLLPGPKTQPSAHPAGSGIPELLPAHQGSRVSHSARARRTSKPPGQLGGG